MASKHSWRLHGCFITKPNQYRKLERWMLLDVLNKVKELSFRLTLWLGKGVSCIISTVDRVHLSLEIKEDWSV